VTRDAILAVGSVLANALVNRQPSRVQFATLLLGSSRSGTELTPAQLLPEQNNHFCVLYMN
jgi:hypothetical protein